MIVSLKLKVLGIFFQIGEQFNWLGQYIVRIMTRNHRIMGLERTLPRIWILTHPNKYLPSLIQKQKVRSPFPYLFWTAFFFSRYAISIGASDIFPFVKRETQNHELNNSDLSQFLSWQCQLLQPADRLLLRVSSCCTLFVICHWKLQIINLSLPDLIFIYSALIACSSSLF